MKLWICILVLLQTSHTYDLMRSCLLIHCCFHFLLTFSDSCRSHTLVKGKKFNQVILADQLNQNEKYHGSFIQFVTNSGSRGAADTPSLENCTVLLGKRYCFYACIYYMLNHLGFSVCLILYFLTPLSENSGSTVGHKEC